MTFGDLRRGAVDSGAVAITAQHHRSLVAHPYAGDDEVAFLLMVASGRRVARFGLLPGWFRAGSDLVRVNWGSEFDYDGDPGNRPFAGLLFLRSLERAGSYGGAGPSGAFEPMLRAAGLDLVPVTRYAGLLRSRAFVARSLGPTARIAGPAADVVLAIERRMRSAWSAQVEAIPIERFDERFDELERARSRCGTYRDHVELNWIVRYPWVSENHYRAYELEHKGRTVGYALTRTRRGSAQAVTTLTRLAFAPESGELLSGALAALMRIAEGDVFDLNTNDGRSAAAARSVGLRTRGALYVTARFEPSAAKVIEREGCSLAAMPFQHGEGDVIFA